MRVRGWLSSRNLASSRASMKCAISPSRVGTFTLGTTLIFPVMLVVSAHGGFSHSFALDERGAEVTMSSNDLRLSFSCFFFSLFFFLSST